MITNQTPRRPEHLHSKRCSSVALIAAIENLRDLENFSDLEFRLAIQANDPKDMADGYLADGLISCKCPPCTCCPA